MADDPLCLFWDSCIFYAYLSDQVSYDLASIDRYLLEARAGDVRIYGSTIALAEVVPSAIKKVGVGSFEKFLADYRGMIVLTETNPNIMLMSARLKDLPYKKGTSPGRKLTTPDAIMLASCLYQRDVMKVPIKEFHTYDDGKSKGIDGKAVPLLSFHEWCDGFDAGQMATVDGVVKLIRRRATHPEPGLPFGGPSQSTAPANDDKATGVNQRIDEKVSPSPIPSEKLEAAVTVISSEPSTAQSTPPTNVGTEPPQPKSDGAP